ncbi:PH domain-containing protein [Thermomonospora cellulosilytica]|uniref:Low molecular weight protein antigen 6 PH domain-containing protein n=1 Tax=Thermomonospora cellulosilytica TaxID=1411118 RepID=A0A7W3MXS2_9ACTN|nr:PH domain-containing protein [Thermomonospora cellulosilytica]MBA9003836.1 hypothetical protein [Thermomonospora cellulosilytica]
MPPAEDPSGTLVLRRSGGWPLAVSVALAMALAALGVVRAPQALWLTFLMVAVSALVVGAWLRMRIEVRPDGLWIRSLRTARLVPWSAVMAAYRSGRTVTVVHSDDRMIVLPGALRHSGGTLTADEMLGLLQRRIEEHAPEPEQALADPERVERRVGGRGALVVLFTVAGAFAAGAVAAGTLTGTPQLAGLPAVLAIITGIVGLQLARAVTVIDAEGVRSRGAFRTTFVPWSDVKDVRFKEDVPIRQVELERHSGGIVTLTALTDGRGPEGLDLDDLVDLIRRRGLGAAD